MQTYLLPSSSNSFTKPGAVFTSYVKLQSISMYNNVPQIRLFKFYTKVSKICCGDDVLDVKRFVAQKTCEVSKFMSTSCSKTSIHVYDNNIIILIWDLLIVPKTSAINELQTAKSSELSNH